MPGWDRVSVSRASRFADTSSRMAAWGQPPVSTAEMRSAGSADLRVRNSASSRVKMSFVTTPSDRSSRSRRHSASVRAVFPLPTGPPMPTVKARSAHLRDAQKAGRPVSRASKLPGDVRCSWLWLWPKRRPRTPRAAQQRARKAIIACI